MTFQKRGASTALAVMLFLPVAACGWFDYDKNQTGSTASNSSGMTTQVQPAGGSTSSGMASSGTSSGMSQGATGTSSASNSTPNTGGVTSGTSSGNRAMTNQNADRSSMGGKHQQVMRAQEALNKQGASLKVDGVLGSQTRDAVKKFQEAHQLKPTGTLDRQTVAQLQM